MRQLQRRLEETGLLTRQGAPGTVSFQTSGDAETLARMRALFDADV